ncbi:MAG: hypothetical protein KAH44_15300 [Oricola sp.]|nr:hypothetical protein [Oricola sp.]
MLDRPLSPKQGSESRRSSPYPYYAGYTEKFVASLLPIIGANAGQTVLDPWNGSGTTTTVAAFAGLRSIGVDLNPVMVIAAYVRSAPSACIEDVCTRFAEIMARRRRIEADESPFEYCANIYNEYISLSEIDSCSIAKFGLMVACRSLARSIRSKNPTWFRLRDMNDFEVSEASIIDAISNSFASLDSWAKSRNYTPIEFEPILIEGDWSSVSIDRSIDHVITSPPYLTRIDYVMKTLPELIFLSRIQPTDLALLRSSMLGTVLTDREFAGLSFSRCPTAASSVTSISEHNSKASSTYYRTFFTQYLSRLFHSLKRGAQMQPRPKSFTIVSQGSYYKERLIDLPAIIDEFMCLLGYQVSMRYEYANRRNIALVNSRAHAATAISPDEVVCIYKRSV